MQATSHKSESNASIVWKRLCSQGCAVDCCSCHASANLAANKTEIVAGQQAKAVDKPHGVDVGVRAVAKSLVADAVRLCQPDLLTIVVERLTLWYACSAPSLYAHLWHAVSDCTIGNVAQKTLGKIEIPGVVETAGIDLLRVVSSVVVCPWKVTVSEKCATGGSSNKSSGRRVQAGRGASGGKRSLREGERHTKHNRSPWKKEKPPHSIPSMAVSKSYVWKLSASSVSPT